MMTSADEPTPAQIFESWRSEVPEEDPDLFCDFEGYLGKMVVNPEDHHAWFIHDIGFDPLEAIYVVTINPRAPNDNELREEEDIMVPLDTIELWII